MLLPAVRDSIFSCAHCGQASLGRGGYGTGALRVLVDIIADVLRQDSDDEDAEAKNAVYSDQVTELQAEVRILERRNGLMDAELRLWKAQANELQVT